MNHHAKKKKRGWRGGGAGEEGGAGRIQIDHGDHGDHGENIAFCRLSYPLCPTLVNHTPVHLHLSYSHFIADVAYVIWPWIISLGRTLVSGLPVSL